jgi:hypothetical protein
MRLLVSTDSGVLAYPSTRRQVAISSSGLRQGPIESDSGTAFAPDAASASLLPRPSLHFNQSQTGQQRTHRLNSRLVWKKRANGNDYALNLADDADDHSGEPAHYMLVSTNGTVKRFFKLQYVRFHGRWHVASGAAYDIDGSGHWSQAVFFNASDLSVASARKSLLRSAVDALAVAGSTLLPAMLNAQTTGFYSPVACALDSFEIALATGGLIDAAFAAYAYYESQINCGATTDGGAAPPGTPTLPPVYTTSSCSEVVIYSDYYINDMYVGSDKSYITVCS